MQFFVRYGKIVGNNVCRLKREAQIFPYLGRGRNMQRDGTLGYYDDHAEEFYKGTVNVAFAAMQERFLEKLEKGAYILDFGCGSGRDTKYFLERGYRVEAADGSERLCELAEE